MNWPAAWLAFLLLFTPVSGRADTSVPTAAAASIEGLPVSDVGYQVPDGIARSEVAEITSVRAGDAFSMRQVDLDVRRLYLTLPVRNVEVFADEIDGSVRLRYVLLPRILVRDITFYGVRNLEEQEILGVLEIKEGAEFQPESVPAIEASLQRVYRENGYFQARIEVDVRERGGRQVDLRVNIVEGDRAVVERVRFGGTGGLLPFVQQAFTLQAGDRFSRTAMLGAQENLAAALVARGYLQYRMEEPAVAWNSASNTVTLALVVETGARISVVIQGNRYFSRRDLIDLLNLDRGEPLPPGGAEDIRRRLLGLYQSAGFIDAVVELDIEEQTDGNLRRYVFRITEGRQRYIDVVRFEGAGALSADMLSASQPVRPRRWYSLFFSSADGTFPLTNREQGSESLLDVYRRHGYLGARVESWNLREEDGDLALVYDIDEGVQSRIAAIEIEGNRFFEPDELLEKLGLRPGDPFDPFRFNAGVDRIRSAYRSLGFLDARVDEGSTYADGPESVTLRLQISEGIRYRVGQIFLQGNTRTNDEVLRRHLLMQQGEFVNPELFLDTQRRLYRLGIFGAVGVEVLSTDVRAGVANLLVKVQERRNGSVDLGIGLGTAEGLSLSAEAAHRNLFGTARSIRALGEISWFFTAFDTFETPSEYHIDLGYREPWLFSGDWAGRVNYINELSHRERTYNYTINRIILGGERTLEPHWRFIPQYSWEKDRFFHKTAPVDCDVSLAEAMRCQNVDVPNIDLPSSASERIFYVAGLDSFVIADYRNDQFNPTRGTIGTYRLFYGVPQIGSDFHFVRQDLSVGHYFRLADRWGLNAVVRTGYIALLPPSSYLIKTHKYVLGGVNSVRGYGLDRIYIPVGGARIPSGEDGGLAMLNYQLEFRFPLVWNLGGVLFHDAGRVWSGFQDVELPLLMTAGTGLRYDTPVGPIRLDVGWKLNRDQAADILKVPSVDLLSPYEIHFAIGAPF